MTVARRSTTISLAAALLATGALLTGGRTEKTPVPVGGPLSVAQAWPRAAHADLPELLLTPALFLNATTVVGTTPTRDGAFLRLVVQTPDGGQRELRRLPTRGDPRFDNVTAAGGQLLWTETTDGAPLQIWTADVRAGRPSRLLTADTGNALFYGNQYDLLVNGGRVYWAAGPADGGPVTQIRSVALTGGSVRIGEQPGEWALSAWPWLSDDAGGAAGTTRLRNMETGQETPVAATGAELSTCGPVWCRVMVMAGGRLARTDLMHPDGSGRRRIAGPGAQTAVTDVAVLGRFEILSEPGPESDLTGTAGLLVYDLSTGRTIRLTAAAGNAYTRDGMLWWSTGDQETTLWHTLDLRTA
jgi:hypothetical protein